MVGTPASSRGTIAREQVGGNTVSIPNNDVADLTWDALSSGAALLDLSAPAAPTVVSAGVYFVSVTYLIAGAFTAAGQFEADLRLDSTGESPIAHALTGPAKVGVVPSVTLALTYYLPRGATLNANVFNSDGVAARDFYLAAVVQQLA